MNNGRITEYLLCKDYKRRQLDFNQIQRDPNNPRDSYGCGLYPILLSHKVGSSYIYQIIIDGEIGYFKRDQQDGSSLASDTIISLHHYNKKHNALHGSLDDVAEVACYYLSKLMVNPKTGKPLVDVAEYELAVYEDKDGITQRGCVSKTVCKEPGSKLVSMADILARVGMVGNSIPVYMEALENYCRVNKLDFDKETIRRTLVKNSYFCWKVANSDNHKNNVTFIIKPTGNGKGTIEVSPLIDNGSAYELSAPYYSKDTESPRFLTILNNPEYSTVDDNGNREFAFAVYPNMHTAFHLDEESLLFSNSNLFEGKTFAYEYCLASEILSDPELFYEVSEIEKQFNLKGMQDEFDRTYGSAAYDNQFNWPPLLKEYMAETNACKSRTLAFVTADYYLYAAYSTCFEPANRDNPSALYNRFRDAFLTLPLQSCKEDYDALFVQVAKSLGYEVDASKLKELKFKKEPEMLKPEQQPN